MTRWHDARVTVAGEPIRFLTRADLGEREAKILAAWDAIDAAREHNVDTGPIPGTQLERQWCLTCEEYRVVDHEGVTLRRSKLFRCLTCDELFAGQVTVMYPEVAE